MYHIVLFKLSPEYTVEEMRKYYYKTYEKLAEVLPEIDEISFIEGHKYLARDSDMDVLIKVNFCNPKGLQKYINHPLHKQFIEATYEHVLKRATFDFDVDTF